MSERVALFATCIVDQILPEIGEAAHYLLRQAGFTVEVPPAQVCCGQPFFNSGLWDEARPLARHTIEVLEPYDIVVVPGGSCTAMIRGHFPHLFDAEPTWQDRARRLAARTFELTEFLVHRTSWHPRPRASLPPVTYHDSCHMNRMLRLHDEPRQLLRAVGYPVIEMAESDVCCGFGGLFSMRMPEVSNAITEEKLRRAIATGAPILATADPGCLMQMRGMLNGANIRVEHVAVLVAEAVRGKHL